MSFFCSSIFFGKRLHVTASNRHAPRQLVPGGPVRENKQPEISPSEEQTDIWQQGK